MRKLIFSTSTLQRRSRFPVGCPHTQGLVMSHTPRRWFILALLLTLVPALAHAQSDTATVLGRITDQSGATVPGATVTLTNLATQIAATAVTDEAGAYQFLNVRVGNYRLQAELQGFATAIAPQVNVTVNARQRV